MRDDPLADFFLRLRELPSKIRDRFFQRSAGGEKAAFGFDSFTRLQHDDYEISMGLIGRFWNPVMDFHDIEGAQEFCAFEDNSMAKLVLRYLVVQRDNGPSVLVTETFIHCPSRRTKMFFTPYWLAIRLTSGWLRKRTLRTVRQKLNSPSGPRSAA